VRDVREKVILGIVGRFRRALRLLESLFAELSLGIVAEHFHETEAGAAGIAQRCAHGAGPELGTIRARISPVIAPCRAAEHALDFAVGSGDRVLAGHDAAQMATARLVHTELEDALCARGS
jgi:hypothetical protein